MNQSLAQSQKRTEAVAKQFSKYVGLDVHAETIAIAVAERGRSGEVRSLGVIPNAPGAIKRALSKVGKFTEMLVCSEAGPTTPTKVGGS